MKEMTTIKAAMEAVRTGYAVTASASHQAGEVILTSCFTSGHVFYTCRMFGIVFAGFLHPEDVFDLFSIRPKATSCMNGWGMNSNWAAYSDSSEHAAYHERLVEHLLDKSSTFCPSRLRKFRAK